MRNWPIVQRPLSKRSSRSRDLIEHGSSAIWLQIRLQELRKNCAMNNFCFKTLKRIGQKWTTVEGEKPFGFFGGPRIVFITSLSTFFFLFHFLSILPQLENRRKWSGARISRVEGKNVYRSMLRWFFWRTQITAVTPIATVNYVIMHVNYVCRNESGNIFFPKWALLDRR